MDSSSGRHGAVTTAPPGDAVAAVQRNAAKAVEDCGLGNHKKNFLKPQVDLAAYAPRNLQVGGVNVCKLRAGINRCDFP